MTHTKTTIFSLFSYLLFSSPCFCMNQNPCEGAITNEDEEKAKKCVQYKFKNDLGLYNMASDSKHLGNINNCEDTVNNYFSKDPSLFNQAVKGVTIRGCKINDRNTGTYRCVGNTPGPACHKKGVTTKEIVAIFDFTKKIFVSFSPSPPYNK